MAVCPAAIVAEVAASEDGLMEKSIAAAVSRMDWGVPGALSVSTSVALLAPTAVGVNMMSTVQFALGATVPLQVSFSEKSAGLTPEKERDAIWRAPEPEFVIAMAIGGLAVPTTCAAKFAFVADRETAD